MALQPTSDSYDTEGKPPTLTMKTRVGLEAGRTPFVVR